VATPSSTPSLSDLEDLLARVTLGEVEPEMAVEWAITQLVGGADTPELRTLAGATRRLITRDDARRSLAAVAGEVGREVPSIDGCIALRGRTIANDIVQMRVEPLEGLRAILALWRLDGSSIDLPVLAWVGAWNALRQASESNDELFESQIVSAAAWHMTREDIEHAIVELARERIDGSATAGD
jgi:hypothetical protein